MTTVDAASLLLDGPWQHRFVAANGARFHLTACGPDDRDAPLVVLLHGVPQFWWAWRHQLPVLGEAGYRTVAMDLRGAGGSDKPPHGNDVPTLAADVAAVIRSLGADRAVVAGVGTGGQVAWALAGRHPSVLRGVAALSAPHPLDTATSPRAVVRPGAVRRLGFVQLPSFPERALVRGDLARRLLAEWGGVPGWPDEEAAATYTRAVRVPFAAHSQMEQLRWLVRSVPRPDGRRYRLSLQGTVPLPVLQLHGGRDGLHPAAHAALSSDVARLVGPGYRFELLRDAGHYLPEQAPEQVTRALLDWLGEVAPVD